MPQHLSAPCGSWKSPVTSDLIIEATIGLEDVMIDGADIYWVESRPQEGGRNEVVRLDLDGTAVDATPPAINVRNRVHEYGEAAAIISEGVVYASNYADQHLYPIGCDGVPYPFTPVGPGTEAAPCHAKGRIDRRRSLEAELCFYAVEVFKTGLRP